MPITFPPLLVIFSLTLNATGQRVFSASTTKMTPSTWETMPGPSGKSVAGGESTMIRSKRSLRGPQNPSLFADSKVFGVSIVVSKRGIT